jgi:TPR repeat protein
MRARLAMFLWVLALPVASAQDVPAAEAGDVRSAEMLALMYRFGPRLFAPGVAADAAESAKWAAIAADMRRREAAGAVATR